MVNPAEIADNLVVLLRDIPDLVAEMGGDPLRIYAYHDAYPDRVSVPLAILNLPAPGLMVVWQGTQPGGFGTTEVWKHQFSLILRAREELAAENPASYYRLFRLITKGIPTGQPQPLQYLSVHSSCHPMDTPSIARQSAIEGLDHFEVLLGFTEIGDD